MRTWEVLVVTAIWSGAPIIGSGGSLVVIPIVALFVLWRREELLRAMVLSVVGLIPVGLGYGLWQIAGGAPVLDALGTGAGIAAIHGVAEVVLVALAWGCVLARGRLADRARGAAE